MNLGSLCKRAVVAIDAQSSLREAATMMRAHHVGAVVVTARQGHRQQVLGVVTDRDLALACVAHELDPATVLVGAIASRTLVRASSTCTVADAAEELRRAGVRRLLVCDGHGQLLGLLSSDDLLAALIEPLQALAYAFQAGMAQEEARSDGSQVEPPSDLYLAPRALAELD
jgi:CBS domain-containing protein